MTINERIFSLLQQKGVSNADLSRGTGIKSNTISDWKTKGTNPASDKIYTISTYLGVTCEYLLTGKSKDKNEEYFEQFTKSDLQTISKFSKLNEAGKDKVDAYIDGLMAGTKFLQEDKPEPEDVRMA